MDSSYHADLALLRETFGEDAEMVMRGVSVASRELDLAEALALVLVVLDHQRRSELIANGLEARVARAMWPDMSEELDGLDEGPLARFKMDVPTTRGVFRTGTEVRVLDRMSGDRILIQVLDQHQSVFPVPESVLESWQSRG